MHKIDTPTTVSMYEDSTCSWSGEYVSDAYSTMVVYYCDPYHDYNSDSMWIFPEPFSHYNNWWDWFRTGKKEQFPRKKKINKPNIKCSKKYWQRTLPSKSGWVGKAMKRKKGK